jgi:WD40 repeat protein
MSQLWEKRDREEGLLNRQAYRDIGGVGGALARHAEATLESIGADRITVVRELFRNLVTAEGTRAVHEWDELLSIFDEPQRESADEVLRALINSRLLTSYEVQVEGEQPRRRVEIIHESLLEKWPRLVGWQTQDADSSRMRDELRYAARGWDENDRAVDRLWTGSVYREFASWRERYPGGLTDLEEAFAAAMTRHAERRKRRRRAAATTTFVVLLAVLAVIGGFWQRSVSEARRAEAANLFSLGQLALEKHPSASIAYAIASLELADNTEVRRLAVEALWLGPTEIRLPTPAFYLFSLDFSADGRWLATADPGGGGCRLWPSDGSPPTVLEGEDLSGSVRISPRGDLVAASKGPGWRDIGLWSLTEGKLLRSLTLSETDPTHVFQFSPDGERLLTYTEIPRDGGEEIMVRSWPVAGGDPVLVARLYAPEESVGAALGMDPTGSRIAWADGREVHVARFADNKAELSSAVTVRHDRTVTFAGFDAQGRQLLTADRAGTILVWALESDPPEPTHSPRGGWAGVAEYLMTDTTGSILAAIGGQLWDLTAPPDTELLMLRNPEWLMAGLAFHPNGRWLATTVENEVSLWPLARTYPRILQADEGYIGKLAFTPDGKYLLSTSADGWFRVWPLSPGSRERSHVIQRAESYSEDPRRITIAPDSSFVVAGTSTGLVTVYPLDGGPARVLAKSGREIIDRIGALAVGPGSRLVAAGSKDIVRIYDLESGAILVVDSGDGEGIRKIEFSDDGELWVVSGPLLRRWSLSGSTPHIVEEISLLNSDFESERLYDIDVVGRKALHRAGDSLWVSDLDTRESRLLSSHGRVERCGLHADGTLVVSSARTGEVRIGPATGEEPHLLLGHKFEVNAMTVSPDGQWIATGCDDKTIRLWPMPDFSKPPLHTLPREELIAKLKTLTNLRAVRDPESSTGWNIEAGPFPGWEKVPTW